MPSTRYYRHSNFQNWCTVENSDAFAYVGCHYVDLVHFITGLLPVAVSLCGIRDRYPNGKEGFLWTDARVIWNNRACLNVQNALGFHSDEYRGLKYYYTRNPSGPGATVYAEPSPDYRVHFGERDRAGGGDQRVG